MLLLCQDNKNSGVFVDNSGMCYLLHHKQRTCVLKVCYTVTNTLIFIRYLLLKILILLTIRHLLYCIVHEGGGVVPVQGCWFPRTCPPTFVCSSL